MMTSRELLHSALRGEPVERVPVSYWKHFPGSDATAEALANQTIKFYERHKLDLVKLTPTGMFQVMDYGVSVRLREDDIGTTRIADSPIHSSVDWQRLPAIDPRRGALGVARDALGLVRAHLPEDVPVLQTLFSPSTLAGKIFKNGLPSLLASGAELVSQVLEHLALDVIAFAEECLRSGGDGFFFATQYANTASLSPGTYEARCAEFDRAVLDTVRARSQILLLHLHGSGPLLELANSYPVDGVSWELSDGGWSLRDAASVTGRGIVGGLTRRGPVLTGPPQAVRNEVSDILAQTAGVRMIVAPECVLPHRADDRLLDVVSECLRNR